METEIDQLFYWQTYLTRLGGVEKTMAFFFEEDEQKHIWHVFEKDYLIPLLERSNKKVETKCKALDGDAEAQRQLGIAYAEKKDVPNAIKWLRKAADQGDQLSFEPVCNLFYFQTKQYDLCLDYAKRGISQGLETVYWYAGNALLMEGNKPAGRAYLEQGSAVGNTMCLNKIGTMDFSAGDYDKAFAIFLHLANKKERDDSKYNLGVCYLNGYGTKENRSLAKEWFEKAAADGNQSAKQQLEKMNSVI